MRAGPILAGSTTASATPSTTFWTPATTYTQPYLVPHLTYDSYFGEPSAYPITTGITVGVLPFEKLQAEVGVDLLYPGLTQNGLLFNAKLALPEGAFGANVPGVSVGVQNIGFEKDVNDLYLVHGEVGKTLPFGVVAVGAYYGVNKKLIVDETGAKKQTGFMASWTSPDIKIGKPALDKYRVPRRRDDGPERLRRRRRRDRALLHPGDRPARRPRVLHQQGRPARRGALAVLAASSTSISTSRPRRSSNPLERREGRPASAAAPFARLARGPRYRVFLSSGAGLNPTVFVGAILDFRARLRVPPDAARAALHDEGAEARHREALVLADALREVLEHRVHDERDLPLRENQRAPPAPSR